MHPDQKANIDAAVKALGESLFSAWSYFHLLRGLQQGSRQHPAVLERFDWLFGQTWRAVFDGFFAKAGTLLDNTKSTYSLPNLVKLIRKYGNSDLLQLLPEVEACLAAKDSPLAKIRRWRHKAVAHRTMDGQNSIFHIENRMNLDELEGALVQLEELLNHLSLNVLSIQNDTLGGTEGLVEEGKALFASVASGLRNGQDEDANG